MRHSPVNKNTKPNFSESFYITRDRAPDHPDIVNNKPLVGLNRWPQDMPELRAATTAYYRAMETMTTRLVPLFALALDLPAERQVADVVLADPERELVPFGAREELLGDGEGVVDQVLRHAVIGDDEKPGVFTGAGDRTRQRRRRSRITGEIRADVEDGNAALARG